MLLEVRFSPGLHAVQRCRHTAEPLFCCLIQPLNPVLLCPVLCDSQPAPCTLHTLPRPLSHLTVHQRLQPQPPDPGPPCLPSGHHKPQNYGAQNGDGHCVNRPGCAGQHPVCGHGHLCSHHHILPAAHGEGGREGGRTRKGKRSTAAAAACCAANQPALTSTLCKTPAPCPSPTPPTCLADVCVLPLPRPPPRRCSCRST